ncbi:hypothetical protein WP12_15235 [Sphingomonas sp. SRS2]|nr:hypothetical protein WP12_15235 [Sphingomonas sp. SRS2]
MVFSSLERPSEIGCADLLKESVAVAAGLSALGLRQGDIILSQTPHWKEGVALFLATLRLGIILVPVVHIYGPAEVDFLLAQTGAKALVLPDRWGNIDYGDRVSRLSSFHALDNIVVIGATGAMPGPALTWDEMLSRGTGTEPPQAVVRPEDICVINFTSGTTSAPKGVMHSNRSLRAEVIQSSAYVARAPAGAALITSPAGHIGGLTASLRPFLSQEDTVFLDRWDLGRAIAMIERYDVARGLCTPFHVNALLGAGNRPRSLRQLMVGGAGVSPTLIERLDDAGISGFRCWGCTEQPTATSSLPHDPLHARAFTDGAAMHGCAVRLRNDAGELAAIGERGEVESIGPELFEGYLDPSLNAAAFTSDGWYRTGDIGVLDAAGLLTIVDRKKDIIIRGGENISSKEVEDALLLHPRIAEAAAVGIPDPTYGERVAAFVTLNGDVPLTLDDLVLHFETRGIARQKTPEHLFIIDDFPRNPSGKILKTMLRDRTRDIAR